ncbi:MAG: right-handed parallel beta-helix repeat-containing protein [Verrucomicrobiota bacterium]
MNRILRQFAGWVLLTAAFCQTRAMAGEFTVTLGDPLAPPPQLVRHGDDWRFFKGRSEPQSNWQTVSDAELSNAWDSGPGGLGYGDDDDATVLSDMPDNFSSLYVRKTFLLLTAAPAAAELKLTVDFDDGFVAWLDGVEIMRINAPGSSEQHVPFDATATGAHEASAGENGNPPVIFNLGAVGNRLGPGPHVLAIQGLNQATNSSDFSLIADLSLSGEGIDENGMYTRVTTHRVRLSGFATLEGSANVTWNSAIAPVDPLTGRWDLDLELAPGMNRIELALRDRLGHVLARRQRDLIFQQTLSKFGDVLPSVTDWSPALGLIQVTNRLIVPAEGHLNIAPGTVVLFEQGAGLAATNAVLEILGSKQQPIFLLPVEGAATWRGIDLQGANARFTMQSAEAAGAAIRLSNGVKVLLDHATVRDYLVNEPLVLTASAGEVLVRHSQFRNYYETLWRFGKIVIEDSLFENFLSDNSDGIDYDGALPGSVIRRCTIRNGMQTNTDAIDLGSGSMETLVEDCYLAHCTDKGVSIGEDSFGITVRNCLIRNVGIGVEVKDSCTASVMQNTIVESDLGFRLRIKTGTQGGHITNAFNNILWDNTTAIVRLDDSTIVIDHSAIEGGWEGEGNVNSNPQFVNAARGDFRLAPTSPLASAGRNGSSMGVQFPVGTDLLDSDHDGMPDSWEMTFGLDLLNDLDADLDVDNDGMSNKLESLAGTNPLLAESALKLEATEVTEAEVLITFRGIARRSYRVESAVDLAKSNWIVVSEVPMQTMSEVVRVVVSRGTDSNAHAFYRLVCFGDR